VVAKKSKASARKKPASKKKAVPSKKKTVAKAGPSHKKKGNGGSPESVVFHYIKGAQFRAIHVDGAIGGPTPNGYIHMAVFSERAPIPQQVEIELTERGSLGQERSRTARTGVVRELEADLFMSAATAEQLRVWLEDNIEKLEEAKKSSGQVIKKGRKKSQRKAKKRRSNGR
jgi:hypothetical protein